MKAILSLALVSLSFTDPLQAVDSVSLSLLRSWYPYLDGSGINLVQVEAGGTTWQVNPNEVGQPESLFTWHASDGETNRFPNQLGEESGHANQVGGIFYGLPGGMAPGAALVQNFEALHFYMSVQSLTPVLGKVVNQSFAFAGELTAIDRDYDDYAARFGTLFVSGAGNGGSPLSPATAYNGICVAAFDGLSSIGPTLDGRSKPDITVPASQTSFSTPFVAGAAALLCQAGLDGIGGSNDTIQASDYRTIKALLLNGAEKPNGWTNGTTTPLDARHGSGILNVFNSLRTLRSGSCTPNGQASYNVAGSHVPPLNETPKSARRGWSFAELTSSVTQNGGHHFAFEILPINAPGANLKATLVWERGETQAAINNLDLFLYRGDTGALVASSESTVDNVEHVFVLLPGAGRYVLQVLKRGGIPGRVTANQTYALAFDFGPARDATITNLRFQDGTFTASLEGEPFAAYSVERSADFQDWQAVAMITLPGSGIMAFEDVPSLFQRHFVYRARLAN